MKHGVFVFVVIYNVLLPSLTTYNYVQGIMDAGLVYTGSRIIHRMPLGYDLWPGDGRYGGSICNGYYNRKEAIHGLCYRVYITDIIQVYVTGITIERKLFMVYVIVFI